MFPTLFVVASCVAAVASVLNALSLSITFPLRGSLDPVLSIELESDFFSVFSAFLPTVSFPLVVSTAGVSFFSTGLAFNFAFTVVIKFAYAFSTSTFVVAFAAWLAFEIASRNKAKLSSVFDSYLPEDKLPSIFLTYEANFSFEATNSF